MISPRLEAITSLYAVCLVKSSRWPPAGFSANTNSPRKANLFSWRNSLELGSLIDSLINLDTAPADADEEIIRRAVLRTWIHATSSTGSTA